MRDSGKGHSNEVGLSTKTDGRVHPCDCEDDSLGIVSDWSSYLDDTVPNMPSKHYGDAPVL